MEIQIVDPLKTGLADQLRAVGMTGKTHSLLPLAEETTDLLKALAHPARLMICCQLRGGEMSVGNLETTLGIRQPRLSRELGKLRDEGLIEARRESKVVFYRLAETGRVGPMIDAICAVMLGQEQTGHVAAARVGPSGFKPNHVGGYGVFARTDTET